MTKKCDKCGVDVPSISKFCPECGAKLENTHNTEDKSLKIKKGVALGLLLIIVAIGFIQYESDQMSLQEYNEESQAQINATMNEYDIHSAVDASLIVEMHSGTNISEDFVFNNTIDITNQMINSDYPSLVDENNLADEYRYQYINGEISESDFISKINNLVDNDSELEAAYSYMLPNS